ncbi:NAD(+)--arginine ADP-ribosyltransferase EFV [compost metagenome]
MRRAQPKDRARPQHQTRAEIITNGATHAAYLRHERIGQKAIAALAERQRKAVIRELRNRERQDVPLLPDATAPDGALNVVMSETFEGEGTLTLAGVVRAADGLFDMRFWIGETRKALEPFLEGTWGDGGSTIAAALGLSWDVFDAGVLTSMEQRLALLSTQMTDTTARALEAGIIAAGAEEGLSIDDMARRLGAVFEDLKGWRGKMIARTETVSGFNMAQHQVAAQSGVQLRKRWLATSDARTRESHRRVDGDTVPMTGVFANGLQFAGDPNGSPSETIQCRCTTLYEEI